MTAASILWRRLDTPGHDVCRLTETGAGRRLDGAAVFLHEGLPALLSYAVTFDASWQTERGDINGFVGTEPFAVEIVRSSDGIWTHNGDVIRGLEEYVDLDLGFSPATNLSQIRRLGLAVGEAADCAVAWLDMSTEKLDVLHQRYERRTDSTYRYEAPRFGYAATLEVDELGFVRRYPALWEAEPAAEFTE